MSDKDQIKVSDAGKLIGKYLRETKKLRWIEKILSDDQIGELIFNSDRNGGLVDFFGYYYEAVEYYKNIKETKSKERGASMRVRDTLIACELCPGSVNGDFTQPPQEEDCPKDCPHMIECNSEVINTFGSKIHW